MKRTNHRPIDPLIPSSCDCGPAPGSDHTRGTHECSRVGGWRTPWRGMLGSAAGAAVGLLLGLALGVLLGVGVGRDVDRPEGLWIAGLPSIMTGALSLVGAGRSD